MARSTSRCHGRVTNAIAVMSTTKLTSERTTSSFRPKRSATRPHAGARSAVSAGVIPRQMPVHAATAPTSRTPSAAMYSGRKGITSVKPVNPMKLAAVSARRFFRTADAESTAGRPTSTCRTRSEARACRGSACPRSEPDLHVVGVVHVNAVDKPHLARLGLHDQRLGPDAVTEKADPLHERAIGHAGRREHERAAG